MEVIALTGLAQQRAWEHRNKMSEDTSYDGPSTGLRISVVGGGCSGLQYKLGLDDPREEDLIHEYSNGLQVIVDEKSALYLTGSELQYFDGLDKSGFEVVNPNASNTCGCGSSFAA